MSGLLAAWGDAHTLKYARCARAAEAVAIDGRLGEWDEAEAIRVAHSLVSYGEKPRDDADASYVFYTLWDSKDLYVAAYVRDDSIVAAFTGRKIYENDSIEVCLDVLHDSEEGRYDADDFQFVFSVPKDPAAGPLKHLYRNPSKKDPEAPDVRLAYALAPGGYVLEAAIPWKMLGLEIAPKRPAVLGFQNSLRDRDADGSAAGLSWQDLEDPASSPLDFGHLVLVDKKGADLKSIEAQLGTHSARLQKLVQGEAQEKAGEITLTLGGKLPRPLTRGIGWNVQFYDGRIPSWSDADWKAFFGLLKWSRPAWVRYGLNLGQWEPSNDDADALHFQWDQFRFDSKIMQHHCRMMDFFEAEGVDVMICNWYVGDPASGAFWLSELQGKSGVPADHAYAFDAPASDDELVESLAALVHFLKVEKKYSCVKFLSLWNEPDGHWTYNSPNARYPETFWPLYQKLDSRLRNMGLREEIGLAGPDAATESYPGLLEIPALLETYRSPLDLLADHDYAAYFDYYRPAGSNTITRALLSYSLFMERLEVACRRLNRGRPDFAITEYGNHGNGPGPVEGDGEVFRGSLALQEFVLRTLPLGISGYLRWEFKPYGLAWQNFGALTKLQRGYRFAPYPPVFYPHAMLTRYSRRGASVVDTKLEGGRDEHDSPRVNAAAILPETGQLTLWLTNSGKFEREVTILPGPHQEEIARLTGLLYESDSRHRFGLLKIQREGERIACSLPPHSFAVLTTLESPDSPELQRPLELSPRINEPSYQEFDVGGFPRMVVRFSFEESIEWELWHSSPGRSELGVSRAEAADGGQSGSISYDFVSPATEGRNEHFVATTPLDFPAVPLELNVRIYGDGSGHRMNFLFVDDRGETFESPASITIQWQGWKTIHLEIEGLPAKWSHWGEHSDGILDFPFRGIGFIFREREKSYVGRGKVLLDDLRLLGRPVLPIESGSGN